MIRRLVLEHIARIERNARKSGISRAAWLRKANISQSTYYRWKKGESLPNIDTIARLEKQ